MRYISLALFLMTTLIFQAPAAQAVPLTFVGHLNSAEEKNPLDTSTATGLATIILDPTAQTIQITATFSGLTSNDVAAHIHCCMSLGTNAGVATTVPAFPGFPLGVTAGSYLQTLNLADAASYNPVFITNNGGTVASAEAVLIAGLLAGNTYLNIHTTAF